MSMNENRWSLNLREWYCFVDNFEKCDPEKYVYMI